MQAKDSKKQLLEKKATKGTKVEQLQSENANLKSKLLKLENSKDSDSSKEKELVNQVSKLTNENNILKVELEQSKQKISSLVVENASGLVDPTKSLNNDGEKLELIIRNKDMEIIDLKTKFDESQRSLANLTENLGNLELQLNDFESRKMEFIDVLWLLI